MPDLAEILSGHAEFFRQLRDVLARGWEVPEARRPLLLAAIAHALDFQTWNSLTRELGLDDAGAIDVMVAMVQGVAVG
jgi:hypothetical protein